MVELVERAKHSDADAFSQLVAMQTQIMYKTAWAIMRNDEDAADAIQDAVLACWQGIGQLQNPEYFGTWLMRILVNKCYGALRKRACVDVVESVPERSSGSDVAAEVEWQDMLAWLDEKYRVCVSLHYGDGFTSAQIAQVLDIPVSTVTTRLQRARAQLEAYFNASDVRRAVQQ